MLIIMSKLKKQKATSTFMKPEHLILGSPALIVHLQLLFNALSIHCYVPTEFLKGIVTPLVKDREGDLSDPDDYRGIFLSHILSFLYEHGLVLKFGHYLDSNSLQFGYKSKHSTNHALYVLRSCVD